MGGLSRICRAFGGLNVTAKGETVKYVWDYVTETPRLESEMTKEEIAASEKKKWELIMQQNTLLNNDKNI